MYGLSDMVEEKRGEIKALENKVKLLEKEDKEIKRAVNKFLGELIGDINERFKNLKRR